MLLFSISISDLERQEQEGPGAHPLREEPRVHEDRQTGLIEVLYSHAYRGFLTTRECGACGLCPYIDIGSFRA